MEFNSTPSLTEAHSKRKFQDKEICETNKKRKILPSPNIEQTSAEPVISIKTEPEDPITIETLNQFPNAEEVEIKQEPDIQVGSDIVLEFESTKEIYTIKALPDIPQIKEEDEEKEEEEEFQSITPVNSSAEDIKTPDSEEIHHSEDSSDMLHQQPITSKICSPVNSSKSIHGPISDSAEDGEETSSQCKDTFLKALEKSVNAGDDDYDFLIKCFKPMKLMNKTQNQEFRAGVTDIILDILCNGQDI